jgi:ABC-type Fe3+ transport system substrate-binding protein
MTDRINLKRRRLARLVLSGAAGSLALGVSSLFAQQTHPRAHSPSENTPHAGMGAQRSADERRVVVLTSYAEELSARFQRAFEARHPGRRVEILWRHSADALAYLRRGGIREIDVYWTPSPRNFAILKAEGKLAKLSVDQAALPPTLAGFPISDPDGYFAAFELAGYGIAYNPGAVEKLGLPPPRDWRDLAHPAYRGQVQLPIPGRVGFAPVLIEAVLQGYGWNEGWATLAGIAANAEFGGGDRAPDVDDVLIGHKAARMTIDFFAAPAARRQNDAVRQDSAIRQDNAIRQDQDMAFVYPPRTAYNPAQVAISAEAPHPEAAREFVDFVLSREGQALLLDPDVRRLPVRKEIYADHPEIGAQPFAAGNFAYSDALSRSRQGLVAALFDVALVAPHAKAVPLWQALHRAEQAHLGSAADRREARALLTAMPLDEAGQQDEILRRHFDFPERAPGLPEPPATPERLAIEAAWQADVAARLSKASALVPVLRTATF